jgi:hypothetical protein
MKRQQDAGGIKLPLLSIREEGGICVKPTPGCPLEADVYLCMGLSGWDLRTLASSVTMSSALEVELVRRSRVPRDLSSSDVILGVWREKS